MFSTSVCHRTNTGENFLEGFGSWFSSTEAGIFFTDTDNGNSLKQTGRKPASWGCGYMVNYASWDHSFGDAIDSNGNWYGGSLGMPICGAARVISGYDGNGSGSPTYGCSYVYSGYGCARGDQWNSPIYGYVTRTRLKVYDKESGLFSHGVGVPYIAQNMGIFSTR